MGKLADFFPRRPSLLLPQLYVFIGFFWGGRKGHKVWFAGMIDPGL